MREEEKEEGKRKERGRKEEGKRNREWGIEKGLEEKVRGGGKVRGSEKK